MAKKNIGHAVKKMKYSGYEVDRHLDVWDPNDHIDKVQCTLFGRPCQQTFSAFFVWEKLLGPLEFTRFVEIGTGFGNTSIFFLLHCIQKGASFVTFERMTNRSTNSSPLKELLQFQECVVLGDAYAPASSQFALELIAKPGRTVLFLDGGDKPHEFRLFVPALKQGDIVAVHDWGRAIKDSWVQDTIDTCGLTPLMEAEHLQHGTLTAMFERSGLNDTR